MRHSHSSPRRRICALAPLLLLSVLITLPAQALPPEIPSHQLVWDRWTVSEGLPQITVNSIVQDHNDYIWVASQEGIARFDGEQFQRYDRLDHPALQHNFVNTLAVDGEGKVWTGSIGGLARGDHRGFEAIGNEDMETGHVITLLPDGEDGMWVGGHNGLFLATADGLERHPAIEENEVVTSLTRDDKDRLIVATPQRLIFHVTADSAEALSITPETGPNTILNILHEKDRGLWVAGEHGLFLLDEEGRLIEQRLSERSVEALLLDSRGNLWVSTDDGLYRRTVDGDMVRSRIPGLTTTDWVRALHQDGEGNLWVGTQLEGLYRLYPGRFRAIREVDGLSDGAVWSSYLDPAGGLWAGGPDGVFHGGLTGFSQPIDSNALPHPMSLSFLRDSHGGFWIGTRSGLAHLPFGNDHVIIREDIPLAAIGGLLEDDQQRLWVATNSGLYRIDDLSGASLARDMNDMIGTQRVAVRSLTKDQDGRLWLASSDGVYRETDEGFQPVGDGELFRNEAFAIKILDEDTTLAAFAQGLAWFGKEGERLLGREDGFHSDTFMYLHRRGDELWYNTNAGIGVTSIEALRAYIRGESSHIESRIFGHMDGPQSAQCNGGQKNTGALTEGRWLWCPSLSGLLALDLERTDPATDTPRPLIQTLRVGEKIHEVESQHFDANHPLVLERGQRDLEIRFTGIRFRANENMLFRVRLDGWDEQWRTLSDRRTSVYTNLPPGRYRFDVIALNEDGIPSPQAASLTLSIPPYWHETGLARAGMMVGLLLLIMGGVQWRFQRMEAHRRKLRGLVDERTRQLQTANKKLRESSLTDPLTGLRNRRFLSEQIDHDLAQAVRDQARSPRPDNSELAFMMVDLDHFKAINDEYGHATGDELLKQFARLLESQLRRSDYCLRWGGEEFLIVCRQTGEAAVLHCVERLMNETRQRAFSSGHHTLSCRCSIGLVRFPPRQLHQGEHPSWEECVEMADAAAYLAKREGRDRWVTFEIIGEWWKAGFLDQLQSEPEALAEARQIIIHREKG